MSEKPMRTEAIKRFLMASTHPDLAAMYGPEMEVQVMVGQRNGERKDAEYKGRKWTAWTDGVNTWKSFRIPYNAATKPEYTDVPMSFDLTVYTDGIGMTGWDWKNKVSKWVAFDFDAIAGHSEKHAAKLEADELDAVRAEASKLDWVTVRKSTSGKGLHLYVKLPDVPTENHTEHAALARAILGLMSAITGFGFDAKVDNCGGNMWVWHTKMKGTDGLKVLKEGGVLHEIPANWKDHVKVTSGKRKRTLPQFVIEDAKGQATDEADAAFQELTGQRVHVPLDDGHKKLIEFLREEFPSGWWWDQDHHMLVTHTAYLKKAHDDLRLRGIFDTLATGKENTDWNCFGGDTEILTLDGVKTLKEVVGTKQKLLVLTETGSKWIESEIKSFGIQQTRTLYFGDGSSVDATDMHQWLYRKNGKVSISDRKATWELVKSKTELPLMQQELPDIDYEGYAHGFVFGDGWVTNKHKSDVALFGPKKDMLNLLAKYGSIGTHYVEGHGHVPEVRNLPQEWKMLPENKSKEYWLGFILGLASADGAVNTRLQIFNKSIEVIEEIRRKGSWVGLRPLTLGEIESDSNYKPGSTQFVARFNTYNLKPDMFIRGDQRKTLKVRKKAHSTTVSTFGNVKIQEVFCAVVPRYHNFTLANNIVTGNCYAFPLRKGAWAVRRYTRGVKESETWDQDGAGWTRCYLNKEPDLAVACRAFEGVEHPKGGFVFQTAEMAIKAALMLGVNIEIPPVMMQRETKLIQHKDGRLLVELVSDLKVDAQAGGMAGWLPEKKLWKRLYNANLNSQENEIETQKCDDIIRHVVDESLEDAGWVIKTDGEWHIEPVGNIQAALASLGYLPKDTKVIIGTSVFQCWKIVNKPFQPEYPGNRQWNRNAAQLAFAPTQNLDSLTYPHWQMIMNHCGRGLDDAVANDKWCKANAVLKGADYLKVWLASAFQHPLEPLPYLFFYGPQGSGKSSFHESLQLLLKRGKGYMRADSTLTNQNGFNGELEGAIFCVVEETNMQKNKRAYDRIKDMVTSKLLAIHPKGGTPYLIPNSTKWIQCANEFEACPIFKGDTRITMVFVDSFAEDEPQMSKRQLFPLLEKEAPDFLAELLNLDIPESHERLMLPIIETAEKRNAIQANRTVLQQFLDENCYYVTGAMIPIAEFYERFMEFCPNDEKGLWTKVKIGRELPPPYVKGRSNKNGQFYYGNISWVPYDPQRDGEPKKKLTVGENNMLREGE